MKTLLISLAAVLMAFGTLVAAQTRVPPQSDAPIKPPADRGMMKSPDPSMMKNPSDSGMVVPPPNIGPENIKTPPKNIDPEIAGATKDIDRANRKKSEDKRKSSKRLKERKAAQ